MSEATGENARVFVAVRCRPLPDAKQPKLGLVCNSRRIDKVSLKLDFPGGQSPEASSPVAAEAGSASLRRDGSWTFRCNAYFGPEAKTDELFAHADSIVERALEGHHGAILCHGATGSGKTHTMSGPEVRGEATATGLAQRVAGRMFERIGEKSHAHAGGAVFTVQASFLEVHPGDGSREQLMDLLSEDRRKLEIKQDPLNLKSFVCSNLTKLSVNTADELCDVLRKGRRRCAAIEKTQNCQASCAHCILTVTVESLGVHEGTSAAIVQRGKLMLIDLAGSETVAEPAASPEKTPTKKLALRLSQAASPNKNAALQVQQAASIERALAEVGAIASGTSTGPPKPGDSALALLAQDCLGKGAWALLVATLSPELKAAGDTVKTLTFAQQLTVRSISSKHSIDKEHNSLKELRNKHSNAIRQLHETVGKSKAREEEDREQMEKDMEELRKRVQQHQEASEGLTGKLHETHISKIDQLRQEMTKAMAEETERMRVQSLKDFGDLRASMEKQLLGERSQRRLDGQEALGGAQAALQESVKAQRATEEEASSLRVKLASAEERARLLQARQDELRKERSDLDEERRSLRIEADEQWERLTAAEGEVNQLQAEAKIRKNEIVRISSARTEQTETFSKERESWRDGQAALERSVGEQRRSADEAKRQAELQAMKVQKGHSEEMLDLRMQIERLQSELASHMQDFEEAERLREQLEAEHGELQQQEESVQLQTKEDVERYQGELLEARMRIQELEHMLLEVQESIVAVQDPSFSVLSPTQELSDPESEDG